MSENVLEQVMQLAQQLSTEEKRQLIERLKQDLRASEVPTSRSQSLRGIWKDKFPERLNLDNELSEIRHDWEKKWPKVFRT